MRIPLTLIAILSAVAFPFRAGGGTAGSAPSDVAAPIPAVIKAEKCNASDVQLAILPPKSPESRARPSSLPAIR